MVSAMPDLGRLAGACRRCGSWQVHRSRRRTLGDMLFGLLGFRTVRCHACMTRDHRFAAMLAGFSSHTR